METKSRRLNLRLRKVARERLLQLAKERRMTATREDLILNAPWAAGRRV